MRTERIDEDGRDANIATPPLLLTHWDPDLYPGRSIPLLPELIVHILAYGEVWVKEVDLFFSPQIRTYLSNAANLSAFTSLVDTGRIKIYFQRQKIGDAVKAAAVIRCSMLA